MPRGHPGEPRTPNSGRKKGTRNSKTRYAEQFAQEFLKDQDFTDTVRSILGNASHPHWQWTVELVFAYAYGKPTQRTHHTSDGTLPSHSFQIAWLDYDRFFEAASGNSYALPTPPTELPVADYEGSDGRQEHLGRNASPGWED